MAVNKELAKQVSERLYRHAKLSGGYTEPYLYVHGRKLSLRDQASEVANETTIGIAIVEAYEEMATNLLGRSKRKLEAGETQDQAVKRIIIDELEKRIRLQRIG